MRKTFVQRGVIFKKKIVAQQIRMVASLRDLSQKDLFVFMVHDKGMNPIR